MRYHINHKGEAGVCRATNGGCPFGGEADHFTSPEAARAHFEASQNASTASLSLKEMNAAAKVTDDHTLIEELISHGSDRTLGNLAKNPNLTVDEITAAINKSTNSATRASLFLINHGPHELVTPSDLEEILTRLPASEQRTNSPFYATSSKLNKLINNPSLTDAHYDRVSTSVRINDRIKNRFAVVLGEDNQISAQTTRDYMESSHWHAYPVNADRAVENGKLTETDLMEAPDKFLDHFSATGPSPIMTTKSVDILGRVAVKRGNERLSMWVARDSRTSPNILETMGRFDVQSEYVYKNPNTPRAARTAIAERHPNESYIRMGELRERIGDTEFESIKKPGAGKQLGRSYSESTVNFDMKKVREYNLTNDDIFYLAGARGFNAGASFNPESGVFSGRVDSSD